MKRGLDIKKKPDSGEKFNSFCREENIPVREDYESEADYQRARKEAGVYNNEGGRVNG